MLEIYNTMSISIYANTTKKNYANKTNTVGKTIIYVVRALFPIVWLSTLFFYKEDEEVCLI